MSNTSHTAVEVMKAAPPLSVGGLTLFGIPVSDIVLVGTGIYTALLIVTTLPKAAEAVGKLRGIFNGRNR